MRPSALLSLLALAAVLTPCVLTAQDSPKRLATRAELQASLLLAERSATSTAYGARTKERAQRLATDLRARMRDGDFRVGDQIQIRVQSAELNFLDTLAVSDSLLIDVPNIRSISLRGVLRSELDSVLSTELARSVRDLRVEVRPLLRVAVFGLVTNPGYLTVPSETLLDQLLTLSGGPTADAAPDRMRLMRADTVLLDGKRVQAAIASSRTLDALDVRDGDALYVVRRREQWTLQTTLSIVTLVLALPVAITVLRQ